MSGTTEFTEPLRLYHATAGEPFATFDFDRSNQCVWFLTEREPAEALACDFAKVRRPGPPLVYECLVAIRRVAVVASESALYRLGGGAPSNDRETLLTLASVRLREMGFDGVADMYDGRRESAYAALRPDLIAIQQIHVLNPATFRGTFLHREGSSCASTETSRAS